MTFNCNIHFFVFYNTTFIFVTILLLQFDFGSGAIRPEQEIFGMHKSGETRPTAHTTLYHMYSIDYYSFGMKVSAHGDTGTVPSAGDAKRDARPNCLPNFRHILGFFTFKLPITGIIGFI